MLRPILDLAVTRDGVQSRRGFLRDLAAGAAAGTLTLGWRDLLQAQAAELRRQGKALILLWMDGGPSQYDTFSPKIGSKYQGPASAIPTRVPGIHIADFWPETARVADRLAIIRSMRTTEAEHDRAITLVRTGYPPNPALRYPTFGSLVAREREDVSFDFPAFVRIGKPRIKTRDVDAGVLGVRYASFNVDQAGQLPPNVRPLVSEEVLRRRLALAARFDAEFAAAGAGAEVAEKQSVYERTARFVLSPRLSTFHLDDEPPALRDAYGRTNFGQGCLLARRLVEQGVSFVEVISTGDRNDAGWDTHNNGFRDQPYLCAECDPALATLVLDLEQRGLLEHTLVVWMGEFGRTPKIKPDGGRDHYSKGWPVVLAGGGVRGGQVIGATDADGLDVTDRPVSVPDLCRTFCRVLGIDPDKEYVTSDGRPIRLVDGGSVVEELFG
uniref:DUF1501 domain-containing protein n=1 Tax=Schlesneria paludicola TaxID=360056 RepID=A0A7C4QUL2_9PLAN